VIQNQANSTDTAENSVRRSSVSGGIRRAVALRGLLATAWLLGCGLSGSALEPSTSLANYNRQTWMMENGLPQNTVQALVQTRDGFVWLGTEVGLVRFDGNGFEVFDKNSTPALPGNDVRCLLETRDGALWIGTSEGLARWKDGVVTAFTTKDGLPGKGIRALLEAANGILWAWTDQGLARLNDEERFVDATAKTGFQASAITRVISDGQGVLWVGTQDRASIYRDGRWTVPEPQSGMFPWIPAGPIEFIQAFHGRVASADKSTLAMLDGDKKRGDNALDHFTVGKELPGSRIQSLFADRGLARWVGGKVQRLPVTDPLAMASVLALMEDREGNLWVGTESNGLHILRDQRFRTMGARDELSSDATTAVVEDAAGTLWVGTSGSGLNAIHRSASGESTVRSYSVRNGLLSDVILSLAASPHGGLWVGTPDGLNRISGGKIESFTSAEGLPDDFIRSLLADTDGSRRGLMHWTDGEGGLAGMRMNTFTQTNGLGSDLVGAMARDSNGELWVATFAGLARLRGGRFANYTTANGLSSNVVTALLPRTNGTLLIGTQDHGWNLWDGQRFTAEMRDGLNQRASVVRYRQRDRPLRLHRGRRWNAGDWMLALDRVQRRRWAAQPGDGHQQPSFRLALPRRTPLVCHAQGAG
jgi:ligand-binding sensor domain-containing protein